MTGTGHVDVESRAHARELVRGDRSIRGLAAGPDHVVPAAPVVVAEHEKIDRISVGAETSTTAGGCNIDDVGEAEDAAAAIVVAGFKIDGFDVRDLWCAEVQIAGIGIEQRVEAGGAVDGVPVSLPPSPFSVSLPPPPMRVSSPSPRGARFLRGDNARRARRPLQRTRQPYPCRQRWSCGR